MQIEWKNAHLKWDPDDYNGLTKFESNDILIPELSILHLKDNIYKLNATKIKRTKVELQANGINCVKLNLVFDIKCDSNLYYFPYDKKLCIMKFASNNKLFQDVNKTNEFNYIYTYNTKFLLDLNKFHFFK